jgi:hypothetical protein
MDTNFLVGILVGALITLKVTKFFIKYAEIKYGGKK